MYKVYNSIEFVFSKAAVRKKKNNTRQQWSHIAENLLHILEEEINKHLLVIEGLSPRR